MTRKLSLPLVPTALILIGLLLISLAFVLQTTPTSSAVSGIDTSEARSSSLVLDAPPPYCPHTTGDNPGKGNGNGRDRGRPCGPKAR